LAKVNLGGFKNQQSEIIFGKSYNLILPEAFSLSPHLCPQPQRGEENNRKEL
jgi:hypothetical protein